MNACFTAGQHARARSPRVPSAPPSVRLLERHEADDAQRALTFCRPFIPAGRLWTVEAILSGEEAQGSVMQTDQEEGDEEEEVMNMLPGTKSRKVVRRDSR